MVSRSATLHGGYSAALLAPFRYLGYLTLLLAGLLLGAWLIDAFIVFKIWPDAVQPLEATIAMAAAAAERPFGIAFLRSQGIPWAKGLYHALFVASAIEQIITSDPQQLTPFDQTVQRCFVALLPALKVAMLATKLYALRLALWLSATVPVGALYAVGMIDGLVERSIRRYSGGRESATLYHRAKYAIAGAMGLWLFIYLCVPTTFDLRCGAWMTASAIGLMSRLQWKYYKKYV